jgi:DNA-binding transcriptional MerR regulator
MLSIGEFSRMTHLSIRTLRRYHEAGLLEPETVDRSSGYRYYSGDQIPVAQVIHRLRELEVPLSDIQRILRSPDPDQRAALVGQHVQRLEAELSRTRAAVVSLRRLLSPEPPPLQVELRAEPPATVAAVEDDVAEDDVVAWYAGAMAELDAALGASAGHGPPGGLYENALFENGRGHLLLYRPHPQPPTRGRVHPVRLPAAELVVTTHQGDHDGIDVTYGQLGSWVVDNALTVAGPVRERYLVGPRDTDDSAAWRTEIGWPVFRVANNTQPG